MARINITPGVFIHDDELSEKFVRASGPGGQNVNKVSSAVQLRFDVAASPTLPERVKQKLLSSPDQRMTNDGVLVIEAGRHRTQAANREDALQRLIQIIAKAAFVPRKRIATKPTLGSKKRRLDSKTKRANIKRGRSGNVEWD